MSDETVVLKPVNETEALNKAVAGATSTEDIRAAIMAEATTQTTESDRLAAEQVAAETARVAAATAPEADKPFTCIENIGGKDFEFSAGSQAELDREVANAYRIAYAVQPTNTPAEPTVDPAVAAAEAQAAADAEVARKAALEVQFRNGTITTAEYLEQSGALADVLASKGISIDSLKKAVDQNADTAETLSWQDATNQFLNGPAGADWPGGSKNLKQIGDQIILMGLTDPSSSTYQPDKVAALAQAYAALKSEDRLFPGDEVPAEVVAPVTTETPAPAAAPVVPAAAVTTPAAPRAAATSSSLFGKSSGPSGAPTTPATPAAASVIPSDASPSEILEAWKKGQIAAGNDPNVAFTQTFSRGGR